MFEDLFVLFQCAAATGAIRHDIIDVERSKEVDIDQGETPGAVAVAFGEVGRSATLDLLRGYDVKSLLREDPSRLP